MYNRNRGALPGILAVLLVLFSVSAFAAPVGPDTARQAVEGWLTLDNRPMEAASALSGVASVQAFAGDDGATQYYVVALRPSGFAVVSADDLLEPIVAFQSSGSYLPVPGTPLHDMVRDDMARRMATLQRAGSGLSATSSVTTSAASSRWTRLVSVAGQEFSTEAGIASLSDVRVSPLVQSKWDQSTVSGLNVYNYYTPNNYVCGCVATAQAQIMRFHQFPTAAVGTPSFTISVDGQDESRSLRGGNGSGGAYSWSDMPLVPDENITETQRQAIGALTHDAGVTVGMSYSAGASGSDTLQTGVSLEDTFGYAEAVRGRRLFGLNMAGDLLNTMVNPNLDAGLPAILGITGEAGGHAIVTDGYGYQDNTLYHHLNMGWSGSYNIWYNLPSIETFVDFDSVYKVVYNISPDGDGEIVSGRIVDDAGRPVSGASVMATTDSVCYLAETNDRGIYSFKGMPSDTDMVISASKSGYSFTSCSVSTERSEDSSANCGNVWGADLIATSIGGALAVPLSMLLDGGAPASVSGRFVATVGTIESTTSPIANDKGQLCRSEYGAQADIADWNDLKAYYQSTGDADGIMESGTYFVSRGGDQTYSSTRHYFINRFNGSVPSYYLEHDNIGNHTFSLGSWDTTAPVLCDMQ